MGILDAMDRNENSVIGPDIVPYVSIQELWRALPERVQRCRLAHYQSGKRDASEWPVWLAVGRDLKGKARKHEVEAGCRDQVSIGHCISPSTSWLLTAVFSRGGPWNMEPDVKPLHLNHQIPQQTYTENIHEDADTTKHRQLPFAKLTNRPVRTRKGANTPAQSLC